MTNEVVAGQCYHSKNNEIARARYLNSNCTVTHTERMECFSLQVFHCQNSILRFRIFAMKETSHFITSTPQWHNNIRKKLKDILIQIFTHNNVNKLKSTYIILSIS